MANVLFVGEHPLGSSGCSHMMAALIASVDQSKHKIKIFSGTESPTKEFFEACPIFEGGNN